MNNFDPNRALEILENAADAAFDHKVRLWHTIFVDRSKFLTDPEMVEIAMYCERMEEDKIIEKYEELPDGTVYVLRPIAIIYINEKRYPAIAKELPVEKNEESNEKNVSEGFWSRFSVIFIAGLAVGLVIFALEVIFDFTKNLIFENEVSSHTSEKSCD